MSRTASGGGEGRFFLFFPDLFPPLFLERHFNTKTASHGCLDIENHDCTFADNVCVHRRKNEVFSAENTQSTALGWIHQVYIDTQIFIVPKRTK